MFKILSIDGGGIKGIIPASCLASIEEATGEKIVDHFDLIAGTSTGGILALGLGLEFTARELLSLYMDNGDKIFKKQIWTKIPFLKNYGIFSTRYDTEPLHHLLREKFKGKLLGQSKTRLLIPAFDIIRNDICVFKTAHHERFEMDYKIPAEDIALATSAAPVYFKPHKMLSGKSLVDGGILANNPTLLSVIEGIGVLGWPAEEISVLSLGCSDEMPMYGQLAKKTPGAVDWGRLGLVDLFFNGQNAASLGGAKLLLGDRTDERIRMTSCEFSQGMLSMPHPRADRVHGCSHSASIKENLTALWCVRTHYYLLPCSSLCQRSKSSIVIPARRVSRSAV
jgi:hypothetical protein